MRRPPTFQRPFPPRVETKPQHVVWRTETAAEICLAVAALTLVGTLAHELLSDREVVLASASRRAAAKSLDAREFLRDRAARLEGFIYWEDGRPASHLELEIASYGSESLAGLDWPRPVREARAITDADGRFLLTNLSYGMKRVSLDHGGGVRTVLEHVAYADGYGAQGLRVVIGESTHVECDAIFEDGRAAVDVELEVDACGSNREIVERTTDEYGRVRLPVGWTADGFEYPRVRVRGIGPWITLNTDVGASGLRRLHLDSASIASPLTLPAMPPPAELAQIVSPSSDVVGPEVRISRDGARLELEFSDAKAAVGEFHWIWEPTPRRPLLTRFPIACTSRTSERTSIGTTRGEDPLMLSVSPDPGTLTVLLPGYAPLCVELERRSRLQIAPTRGVEVSVRTYLPFVPFVLETAEGALLKGFTGPFAEVRVCVPRGRLLGHSFADRNGGAGSIQAIVVDGEDDVLRFERGGASVPGSMAVCGLLKGAIQLDREHLGIAVQGRRVWEGAARNEDGYFWVPDVSPGPVSVYAFDRRNGALCSSVAQVVPLREAAAQWIEIALHTEGIRVPGGVFAADEVLVLRDGNGDVVRELRLAEGRLLPDFATWIPHLPAGSYSLAARAAADTATTSIVLASTPPPLHAHDH